MNRPGISPSALAAAKIREVEPAVAFAATGYQEPGILIPYFNADGSPLMVKEKEFARLRLSNPSSGAKYLSPAKSGCQLYIPPGLRAVLTPGCPLGIVEGEFKAIALVEAGFPCVGIGGITSACPRNEAGTPELLPALAHLIAEVRLGRIMFIGDSDTSLIPAFSREAVKLATLAGVPVVLPRIPLDAPGKGPDDLREFWGANFSWNWQAILAAAEPVNIDENHTTLAVRLLRREIDTFPKPDDKAFEKTRERLIKFAASIQGDALAFSDVEQIAVKALQIAKTVFRAAVKAQADIAKVEAAKRDADQALADLGANGSNPLYFDGSAYWRREADLAFGRLCREDARLHLNKAGLSKAGDPAPCDAALHSLQVSNRVDYVGPLCGRPAGLHLENGMRVLATRGPVWIEGKPGECPTIVALVANLFGHAAGDKHAITQCDIFVSWLKLAREAIRHPTQHRPGQVLALVGPVDCGKSLLQSAIITPALGGRCADPGLFFTGKTDFNADLWAAEHLAIGDKALDVEGSQRTTLRNELKRAVAESIFPLHGKCRDGLTFRPVWRISLSANSDPESASNLPALDGGFADKIVYLLAYPTPAPFYDPEALGAREAFAATLRAELPAFLASVDAFEIPRDLLKARYGVTEWHHPAVLNLLNEGDPSKPIAEVLETWIDSWPEEETERELSTVALYQALDEDNDGKLSRLRISTAPNHLGHQLAKLATSSNWIGRLSKTTRRHGGRQRNRAQACWCIKRSPSL